MVAVAVRQRRAGTQTGVLLYEVNLAYAFRRGGHRGACPPGGDKGMPAVREGGRVATCIQLPHGIIPPMVFQVRLSVAQHFSAA